MSLLCIPQPTFVGGLSAGLCAFSSTPSPQYVPMVSLVAVKIRVVFPSMLCWRISDRNATSKTCRYLMFSTDQGRWASREPPATNQPLTHNQPRTEPECQSCLPHRSTNSHVLIRLIAGPLWDYSQTLSRNGQWMKIGLQIGSRMDRERFSNLRDY